MTRTSPLPPAQAASSRKQSSTAERVMRSDKCETSARLEPLGRIDGGVGEGAVRARVVWDAARPGAFEGQQPLHHRPFAVEPAVAGGRLEHRVLAADLIDE